MNGRLNVAICDDDPIMLEAIKGTIKNIFLKQGREIILDVFDSALLLERQMKETEYDLIFLDIEMPKLDGIEFSKRLRANKKKTDIIFVSEREERVFDSLQVHPFGFIRKNSFLKDAVSVIDLYLASNCLLPEESVIFLKQGKGSVSIQIKEIIYIEGNKKRQLIYTTTKKEPYEVYSSLETLEVELESKGFLRIHKGYLVNYRAVRHIDNESLTLTDNTNLPISRRSIKEIRLRYLALMQQDEVIIF